MDSVMKNGSDAPEIIMTDLEGRQHTLAEYKGKVVALVFWSAECPWSSRADESLQPMLDSWGEDVVVLTVASNANETEEEIREAAAERGISPLILDQQQELAQTLGAKITPEAFVFDREGVLRYMGAFDDANFRQPEPTCNYLWEAVESVLIGERPVPSVTNAYGCTIVYDMNH
jgi:peroxiredoxin